MSDSRRRCHQHARNGEAGLSIAETLVALSIAALVLLSAVVSLSTTGKSAEVTVASSDLNLETNRAAKAIADALRQARLQSMVPVPLAPVGASAIQFDHVVAMNASNPVAGTVSAIRMEEDPREPQNGRDDDGDGLIDEWRVVLVTDVFGAEQRTTVLARDVPALGVGEMANGRDDNGDGLVDEAGLSLSLTGDVMLIRLGGIRQLREGEILQAVSEVSVRIRNE